MLRDRLLVSALLFISPLCFAQVSPWPCADQVTMVLNLFASVQACPRRWQRKRSCLIRPI